LQVGGAVEGGFAKKANLTTDEHGWNGFTNLKMVLSELS
jgi:hypothetical protein